MGSTASTPTGYNGSTEAATVAKDLQVHCVNKHVVITGANCGLGFETARVLTQNGADVVLCSRNLQNGEDAVKKIKGLTIYIATKSRIIVGFIEQQPDAKVTAMQLDLGSLISIKSFADKINGLNKPVHILINNAGIMATPKEYTSDGFESQFGVNHLGHFHLTKLLLPLLVKSGTTQSPARIVNLSSIANFAFAPPEGIPFDDIRGEKHYDTFSRYGASKLANILFTKELQRRLDDSVESSGRVLAVSLHPGVIVGTNLIRHFSLSFLTSVYGNLLYRPSEAMKLLAEPQKSIAQGASTTVFAALSPLVQPGGHYSHCNVSDLIHPQGLNIDLQKRLWEESERMVTEALQKK